MQRRCSATRWADCVYSATMYMRGCGVAQAVVAHWKLESRFEVTRALLDRACRSHDKESCYVLAQTLEDGTLGAVDYERAAAINASTCDRLDYLPACDRLGYMAVKGLGGEPNPVHGSMLFYEACARGDGNSCDSLDEATEKGWGGPASPEKALPFYDRGCKLTSEHACQRARELRAAGVVERTGD